MGRTSAFGGGPNRSDWGSDRPHGRQSGDSRSPEQSQQEGLGLVVTSVADRNSAAIPSGGCLRQKVIAAISGLLFYRASCEPCFTSDVDAVGGKGQPQALGPLHTKGLVGVCPLP